MYMCTYVPLARSFWSVICFQHVDQCVFTKHYLSGMKWFHVFSGFMHVTATATQTIFTWVVYSRSWQPKGSPTKTSPSHRENSFIAQALFCHTVHFLISADVSTRNRKHDNAGLNAKPAILRSFCLIVLPLIGLVLGSNPSFTLQICVLLREWHELLLWFSRYSRTQI